MRLYDFNKSTLFEDGMEQPKKCVFTFGRLNPPHYGHGGMIHTLQKVAKQTGADWFLFVSSKNEPEKNPLTFEQKCYWIKTLFPEVAGHLIEDPTIKTPLVAATWLYKQGYRGCTFVAGEDDMPTYSKMIQSGNEHGKKNPDSVKAGKGFVFEPLDFSISPRLASATNARSAVTNNDPEAFGRAILGPKITDPTLLAAVQTQLFPMVRKGMNLGESSGIRENMDHRKDGRAVPELKAALLAKKDEINAVADDKDAVYDMIDSMMTSVAKSHGISGQKMHDLWVDKYGEVPDTWIMNESKSLDKPTKTVAELAEKYKCSMLMVRTELKRGIKVEMEHTSKRSVAKEIAMDHLGEDLDYYKKLAKVDEDYRDAARYAAGAHIGQTRNGGKPYISHPVRVANIVKKYKDSAKLNDILSAAFLHDTIEDTDTDEEQLRKLFGDLVASLVKELTSDKDEIEKVGKTEYLANKMTKMSSWALVIKLADRLDNVSDIKTAKTPEWRKKYKAETEAILSRIEADRQLSGTHKKLIEFIREKLDEVTESARSAKDPINEVADQPYQYKLAKELPYASSYIFQTDSGSRFSVFIELETWSYGTVADVGFTDQSVGEKPTIGVTGKGDAFRVFATVGAIVNEYITNTKPDFITFSGKMSEPGRVKLYDMIAKNIGRYLPGYELSKSRLVHGSGGSDKTYKFKRVAGGESVSEVHSFESLDFSYKFKFDYEDENMSYYSFKPGAKSKITVTIFNNDKTRVGHVSFERTQDGEEKMTGEHSTSASKVLGTVKKIVALHSKKHPYIKTYEFQADKDEPSRVRAYNAIAKRYGGGSINKKNPTYSSFEVPAVAAESLDETLKKVKGKWALVSKSDPKKVLQYYKGDGHPSKDWVNKVEKRVHSFSESNKELDEIELYEPSDNMFPIESAKERLQVAKPTKHVIDGLRLYQLDKNNIHMLILANEQNEPAALVGFFERKNGKIWQVGNAKVYSPYTGKALAAKIYKLVKEIYGKSIQSDIRQSDDAKRLWTKTLPAIGLNPMIYDTDTGYIIDPTNSKINVYSTKNPHRYTWIIERNDSYSERDMLREDGMQILMPYRGLWHDDPISKNDLKKLQQIVSNTIDNRRGSIKLAETDGESAINEFLDVTKTPENFSVYNDGNDTDYDFTVDKTKIEVTINGYIEDYYIVAFQNKSQRRADPHAITGSERDTVFGIFNGVAYCLNDFITKNPRAEVIIMGAKSDELSRIKLYDRAAKFFEKMGFKAITDPVQQQKIFRGNTAGNKIYIYKKKVAAKSQTESAEAGIDDSWFKTGSFKTFKKAAPVKYQTAKTAGTLETLEGPVKYDAGYKIMTGPKGEQYPIPPQKFEELYDVDSDDTATPKKIIKWAKLADHDGVVNTSWGELLNYTAGNDYIVRHGAGDYGVIKKDIFAQTYNTSKITESKNKFSVKSSKDISTLTEEYNRITKK